MPGYRTKSVGVGRKTKWMIKISSPATKKISPFSAYHFYAKPFFAFRAFSFFEYVGVRMFNEGGREWKDGLKEQI